MNTIVISPTTSHQPPTRTMSFCPWNATPPSAHSALRWKLVCRGRLPCGDRSPSSSSDRDAWILLGKMVILLGKTCDFTAEKTDFNGNLLGLNGF